MVWSIQGVMRSVVLGLMILPFVAYTQTTYYVDPAGSDNNSGRSTSLAWRTISKVNNTSFSPGDQILFRRGGVWAECLHPLSQGTSAARVIYGDYGQGSKPIIDAGSAVPGWNSAANWTNRGSNVWSLRLGWWPGRLWLSGIEYGCSGTTNQGSSTPTSRYRWWHDGSSTLYVYSTGNPASTYSDMQMADRSGGTEAMYISGKNYITFKNLEFRRGDVAIDVSGSSHLTFDSCTVLAGTARYGLWLTNASDYCYAVDCLFDRTDTVKHSFEYGGGPVAGNGQDNVALQFANHCEFERCRFGGCSHSGIDIDGRTSENRYSSNNWIHDCEFWGGGDYDRALLMNAIEQKNDCAYNVFERNYIHDMEAVSQVNGDNNRVSYCVFANQKHITFEENNENAQWRSHVIEISDYEPFNEPSNHIMLWNNTFINCETSVHVCGGQQGDVARTQPKYSSIINNIFYNCGGGWSGAAGQKVRDHFGALCFDKPFGNDTKADTVKNNIFYNSWAGTTGGCVAFNGDGAWGFQTLANVSAMNGNNNYGNVISGNIQLDPLVSGAFSIPSNSPAKDAAKSLGLVSDFLGTGVPYGSAPDIGASEYHGTVSSNPTMVLSASSFSEGEQGGKIGLRVSNSGTGTLTWSTSDNASWLRSTRSNDSIGVVCDKNTGSARVGTVSVQGNASNAPLTITVNQDAASQVIPSGPRTFYVSPDGNDANDGLTVSSAWATVAKLNATSLQAGDQVSFRRGGVWTEQLNPGSSGSSSQPIIFASYGSGAAPVIDASGSLPGWNNSANWKSVGANLWEMSVVRFPGRLWFSDVEYGISGNNNGFGTTIPSARYRWWSDGSVLRVYAEGNPATAYSAMRAASVGRLALSVSSHDNLVFRGMEFRGGEVCVELSHSNYLTFDSCAILAHTSQNGLFAHDGSNNGRITNCQLDRLDTVAHVFMFGGSAGATNYQENIHLLGANNWEISGNAIVDFGDAGIFMEGQSASGRVTCGNKIFDNEFYLRSGDYGIAFAMEGDAAGACSRNEVHHNRIHNIVRGGIVEGDHNRVFYNLVDTIRSTPSVGFAYKSAGFDFCNYSSYSDSNEVVNNTIRNCSGPGVIIRSSANHAVVVNNLIVSTGLDSACGINSVGIGLWSGVANATVKNNLIFNNGSPAIVNSQALNGPTTKMTVDVFNNAGGSGNTFAGNIGLDPVLSKEMKIPANSPAHNAGLQVGLTHDFFGNVVPASGSPDIGAFERTTPLPVQLAAVHATVLPGSVVRIQWSTLVEINNQGFFVQRRSKDSTSFKDLPGSFQKAAGNSSVQHDYFFTDSAAGNGSWVYRIRDIDGDGTSLFSEDLPLTVNTVAASELEPVRYSLEQNYPNPFNPSTTIRFAMPRQGHVLLEVYNVLGERIATLVSGLTPAGSHEVKFDAHGLASGMYIYRLQADGMAQLVRKMAVVK